MSLLIEPFGELVDDLTETMSVDERHSVGVDTTMTCGALRALIQTHYAWALREDYHHPSAQALFWYVSAEKLEPRLGRRAEEEGAELEQPLAFGRDVARLYERLAQSPDREPIGALAASPDFRHVVRRVQIATRYPYAEIRDNLIHESMRPIDLLRCKLSFIGASQFDPRSDRWVRIALFKGMPFPDELAGSLRTQDAAA